jgi:DNA-binding NarL/FixJ family response regulator
MTAVRVLLADDQELVRAGLDMLLAGEPDVSVVGQATDGLEAVELAGELRPDVVLMDIRMPGIDGIEATRRLREQAAADEPPHVVILTTFDLDEYVFGAFRAGASGFLLKDAPRHTLLEAVRAAAAGDALVAPGVTRRLIEHFTAPARRTDPPAVLAELTAREQEVLVLIGRGLSNAELAERLVVSEKTVKTHVGRILAKLGLRDRVQAVIFTYEHGLVVPGDKIGP